MTNYSHQRVRARLADYTDMQDRVVLYLGRTADGKFQEGKVEFVDANPYTQRASPYIDLDMEAAQKLMDDLWNCGLRSSEGRGSAGQLEATRYHLEDMRRLVIETIIGGNK